MKEAVSIQDLEYAFHGTMLWWRYTPRGGYGYSYLVPAKFVKLTKKGVTIDALRRDGEWKRVNVSIERLFRRYEHEKIQN